MPPSASSTFDGQVAELAKRFGQAHDLPKVLATFATTPKLKRND